MDKLTEQDGSSLDVVNENLEALKAIFPEALTEDGVDFEVLRQLLGDAIAEGEKNTARNIEGAKIKCGEKHFTELAVGQNPAQYIKATSVDDMMRHG
jgi:hypothetical protein